jgi:histidine triad (HIT) family protein
MNNESNCIFCKIVAGEAASWKVYENEKVYAFLDINPVSKYHTLVIPKKHYRDIFEISEEDMKEVAAVFSHISKLYKAKLGIDNLQIVNSNGKYGQQDVFHLHFHIVPRQEDDGQNIKWKVHPEWRSEFDNLLELLRSSKN